MNVFGFLKAYDAVIKGINLAVRLTRNADRQLLLTPNNDGVVNINWISLWIPRVKPNITMVSRLEAKLANDSSHFIPFTDIQIFKSNIQTTPANNQLFQIRTKRHRPIKLFVVFQVSDRVDGDQTNVKRIFDNIQLRRLRAVLNGTDQYPEREYYCQFSVDSTGAAVPTPDRQDYARLYNELLRAGLRDHDINTGSLVTYDNFQTLFPIFCIDMTHQSEHSVMPNSSLVDVYWSNDNVINYYCWVLVEAYRELEMASSKGMMRAIKVHYGS